MVTYSTVFLESNTGKYYTLEYTTTECNEKGQEYAIKSDTPQKLYVTKMSNGDIFMGHETGEFKTEYGILFLAIVENESFVK